MLSKAEQISKEKYEPVDICNKSRKVYHKPSLEKLGNLHALTLGASPGLGDSNNPGLFQA